MAKDQRNKRDLRAELTERLMEQMEKGEAFWQRPWERGELEAPRNAITNRPYRGVNSQNLMLFSPDASDNRWCTYKQATDAGWNVKKGEHGTQIEKWSEYTHKLTPEEIQKAKSSGIANPATEEKRVGVSYFTVFHASQIDGIPARERPAIELHKDNEVDARLPKLAEELGVSVQHSGARAFYRPSTDTVNLPPLEVFKSGKDHDTIFLHELSHSTGSESRLNRDLSGTFGSEKYAREELRAELSAAMTTMNLGLGFAPDALDREDGREVVSGVDNTSAYLTSWLKALPEVDRKKELMSAISEAQKMSDYLIERTPELEKTAEIGLGNTPSTEQNKAPQQGIDTVQTEKHQEVIVITKRKDLPARYDDQTNTQYVPKDMVRGVFNGVKDHSVFMIGDQQVMIGIGIPKEHLGLTPEQEEAAKGKMVSMFIYPNSRDVQFIVNDQQKDWIVSKEVNEGDLIPSKLYDHRVGLGRDISASFTPTTVSGTLSHINNATSIELKNDKGEVTLVNSFENGGTKLADMKNMMHNHVDVSGDRFGRLHMEHHKIERTPEPEKGAEKLVEKPVEKKAHQPDVSQPSTDKPKVKQYVLTSNKMYTDRQTDDGVISPVQRVRGILNTKVQDTYVVSMTVGGEMVDVNIGTDAFSNISPSDKASFTRAINNGTPVTFNATEDHIQASIDGVYRDITVQVDCHDRIPPSSLMERWPDIGFGSQQGTLVDLSRYRGAVIRDEEGKLAFCRGEVKIGARDDMSKEKALIGQKVSISKNDKTLLLDIQSLERDKNVDKHIHETPAQDELVKNSNTVKLTDYVLTHRTDLSPKVELRPSRYDGDINTERTIKPTQRISGEVISVYGNSILLKDPTKEDLDNNVFINKKLSEEITASLSKGDRVDIGLDDTGKKLTITSISYRDALVAGMTGSLAGFKPKVMTQDFNHPAPPLHLIDAEDVHLDKNKGQTFKGELATVNNDHTVELKTEKGPLLVYGQGGASSETTLNRMVGKKVEVMGGSKGELVVKGVERDKGLSR